MAIMAKSDLLRFQDVRDAYRLIGECRDLGGDPALWQRRMLEGLCRIIGAPAAAGGEGRVGGIPVVDTGFDPSGHERLMAYTHELGPQADPIFGALQQIPGRLVTRTRRQLVSNAVWYRSVAFNDYHRPANVDDQLTSIYQVSEIGVLSVISLHRALGEGEFSPRQQRLLGFFHGELGPLIGQSLASHAEPSFDRLSRRLRETLACLLEGDSEKRVAARLGLSQATIHQYVTALYRHFNVGSRAQLLVTIMRRTGRDRREQLPPSRELNRRLGPQAPLDR
jgi:DNA-binding NarL/FixJ family response regulator